MRSLYPTSGKFFPDGRIAESLQLLFPAFKKSGLNLIRPTGQSGVRHDFGNSGGQRASSSSKPLHRDHAGVGHTPRSGRDNQIRRLTSVQSPKNIERPADPSLLDRCRRPAKAFKHFPVSSNEPDMIPSRKPNDTYENRPVRVGVTVRIEVSRTDAMIKHPANLSVELRLNRFQEFRTTHASPDQPRRGVSHHPVFLRKGQAFPRKYRTLRGIQMYSDTQFRNLAKPSNGLFRVRHVGSQRRRGHKAISVSPKYALGDLWREPEIIGVNNNPPPFCFRSSGHVRDDYNGPGFDQTAKESIR